MCSRLAEVVDHCQTNCSDSHCDNACWRCDAVIQHLTIGPVVGQLFNLACEGGLHNRDSNSKSKCFPSQKSYNICIVGQSGGLCKPCEPACAEKLSRAAP